MQVYILRNTEKHIYGREYSKEKALSLVGAKGERVAFQAIVADRCRNVSLRAQSELNTEFFYEKYVPVTHASGTREIHDTVLYPDPLVDEKRAKRFGDNSAEKELLIWCFADIPRDAEKTEYSVTLCIYADEGQDEVNVKISVMDFCLPKKNGNVTSFLVRCDMIRANDDETLLQKFDSLVEFGLAYGCSPTRIVPCKITDYDKVLERMKKYTRDERCASYSVPYALIKESDPSTGKETERLDMPYLRELFLKMAQESTNELNLFAKANMYVGFIDEPSPEKFCDVRRVYREICELKRRTVNEYDFSQKREVEASLLTMDNIVTAFIKEPLYDAVDTWCAHYWAYSKPEYVYEDKKMRGLGKKSWWYGCLMPWTPIPNLHIDAPMKDHRFESWLRYKFDIKGMLYWAVNLTKKRTDQEYVPCDILQDVWVYPGANGDGLLYYSETDYGDPLPSLRLMSMYLGFQEYEYFTLLDGAARRAIALYGKAFDTRNMLKPVFNRIAAGTMLAYPFDAEYLRLQVGSRVELAQKNIFVESEMDSDGCAVNVYSPGGEVRVNGEKGKRSACGNGFCQAFHFKGNKKLEVEISVMRAAPKTLLIAEKRQKLGVLKAKSAGTKIALAVAGGKLTVHADAFVNEEAPRLFVPSEGKAEHIRTVELDVETLSGDAFILNAVLIDENGGKYHAGYAVAEENAKQHLSVSVTDITQNRLNSEDDMYPIRHPEQNASAREKFCFDKVVGVEIILQNNVKLLDDNRERRISSYDFSITDGFFCLV